MALRTLNVSRLIDDRPIGRLQITVIVLSALVNLLDGMDTQSIGVAAPFIASTLGLKVAEFGPVFSAALLGAALGAIGFGAIADKIGRKPLMIIAMLMIGVFTLLTAEATSFSMLLTLRFLAGIGLGGATPCFIALTSEYAPARNRAACVTLMWAGFPFGGMLGALTNSLLIPEFGWRAIFYLGGVLPLLVAVILIVALPESLKLLVTRRSDSPAARRILARMGVPNIAPDILLTVDDDRLPGQPLRLVFTEGRGVGTLLLWVPFFMGFGILTVAILWTPSLLRLNGISPAATAFVAAFQGLGACIGQASAGKLVQRFGVIPTLVPAFVIGAAATAALGYGASSVGLASLFIFLNGVFMGLGGAGAIALAALIYPTAIRSTGVGLGMAMGRFGQMVGPLVAGGMLGAGWGAGPIMAWIGAGGLIAAVFIVLFKRWTDGRALASAAALGSTAA
jgi:AAHS family 4-hydroxybenzoate transporter-like MFS transporter